MAMRKQVKGTDAEIVIVSSVNDRNVFPPRFKYAIDGVVYEVLEAFEADNAQMRRVMCSDGSITDMTVTTMRKDFTQKRASVILLHNPNDQEDAKDGESKA